MKSVIKFLAEICISLLALNIWLWKLITAIGFVALIGYFLLFYSIPIVGILLWGSFTIVVGFSWLIKFFLRWLIGPPEPDLPSSYSDSYSYDNNTMTDEEWMKYQAKQEKMEEKRNDFRERHGRDPSFWESMFDL